MIYRNKMYDYNEEEYNKIMDQYANNFGLNIGINSAITKILCKDTDEIKRFSTKKDI